MYNNKDMNIYIAHSKNFNFENELYNPLRDSNLNEKHELVFPHEKSDEPYPSKEYLKSICELVIAEVSQKSLGVGIELGWANAYGVPIIAIHKTGSELAASLKGVVKDFVEYTDNDDLISKLERVIET